MQPEHTIIKTTTTRKTEPIKPFSIWVITALYGFVFVSVFDSVATSVELPALEAFWAFNQTRIDRYAALVAEHPDDRRLVILGNSTVRYGTDIDHESMTFPGVDGIRVLRIVNNRANFSDFEPFVEEILRLQPDVILLQADLLGRQRVLEQLSKPALLQNYLKWQVTGQGPWNPAKVDQMELQIDQVDYRDQSEARFERRLRSLNEWQTINLNGQDSQLACDFIERSVGRGIPVVLHYIPVTNRATPLQQRMMSQLTPIVERLANKPGVSLLEYPDDLPSDHFGDFVHMNQQGREVYMSWLVPKLLTLADRFSSED